MGLAADIALVLVPAGRTRAVLGRAFWRMRSWSPFWLTLPIPGRTCSQTFSQSSPLAAPPYFPDAILEFSGEAFARPRGGLRDAGLRSAQPVLVELVIDACSVPSCCLGCAGLELYVLTGRLAMVVVAFSARLPTPSASSLVQRRVRRLGGALDVAAVCFQAYQAGRVVWGPTGRGGPRIPEGPLSKVPPKTVRR